MQADNNQNINKDWLNFAYVLIGIIALNFAAQKVFFRVDLTTEKRYSLSKQTKAVLRNLEQPVYLDVYLDGELNIPLKKFQRNIRELLDEMSIYGKTEFEYTFYNPIENIDDKERNKIMQELSQKGLKITNIHNRDKDGTVSEKKIIPGALLTYNNIEVPINLLENSVGKSSEENIRNSLVSLEYKIINTIYNLAKKETERIVFLEGHGELQDYDVGDLFKELSKAYQVDRGAIEGRPGVLDNYKVAIIAKPMERFSEADKYVIDQYIMNGGKVLWMIDAVHVSIDSLIGGRTFAFPSDFNLDDMFFRYGVRINPSLIQDMQCNMIPVNVAIGNNKPDFQPVPWLYYPLATMPDNSNITRGLNMVWCRFPSPIDIIESRTGITATPLIKSSNFTKLKKTPDFIELSETKEMPVPEQFDAGSQNIGVLLEGNFESVFKNRMLGEFGGKTETKLKSTPTKIAIIADGDFGRNEVRLSQRGPLITPLGFDKYTQQTFGNKAFLSNLISYLADDNNMLELKNKSIKIRILDRNELANNRLKWQLINLLVPIISTIVLAFVVLYLRKRKYA